VACEKGVATAWMQILMSGVPERVLWSIIPQGRVYVWTLLFCMFWFRWSDGGFLPWTLGFSSGHLRWYSWRRKWNPGRFLYGLITFRLLIIISPLRHTHLSPPHEVCDSTGQPAHYCRLSEGLSHLAGLGVKVISVSNEKRGVNSKLSGDFLT
jgi:hypothetical protein